LKKKRNKPLSQYKNRKPHKNEESQFQREGEVSVQVDLIDYSLIELNN